MKKKFLLLLLLILLFAGFIGVRYFMLNNENASGRIKIVSSPSASVFIDSVAIGSTPYEGKQKVGEYMIRLIPEGDATATASWQGKVQVYKNALTCVNRELGPTDISSAGEVFTVTKMETKPKKLQNIHIILSESYLTFSILFIPAMLVDLHIDIGDVFGPNAVTAGWVLLFLSPVLIYWAQQTSANFRKAYESGTPITPSFFMHGPYKITRRPTHLGITLLFVGFSIIIQSPIALISALIAHLITQMNFIKREECILREKYGEAYEIYCNKVGKWL